MMRVGIRIGREPEEEDETVDKAEDVALWQGSIAYLLSSPLLSGLTY